eukprot:Nk52_evm1s2646 gene=Nk52_evmTU1s2646
MQQRQQPVEVSEARPSSGRGFLSDADWVEELTKSLEEVRFGVESAELRDQKAVGGDTEAHCSAVVVTLEGKRYDVFLSTYGYKIVGGTDEGSVGKCYETLPTLLNNISPGFLERFHESLAGKLQVLADKEEKE